MDNTESLGAFTIEEFGHLFGIKRVTIHRRIKEGKLRAVKNGHRTLILRKDAYEFQRSLEQVEPAKQLESA